MFNRIFSKAVIVLGEFDMLDEADNTPLGGLLSVRQHVDQLGAEGYDIVFKFAIFSCVISLMGIIIARLIFRIASPREDARAKSIIQSCLVVTFVISFVLTIFKIIMFVAGSL